VRIGTPVKLFEPRYFTGRGGRYIARPYDVSPDGQRFLMIKEPDGDGPPAVPGLIVVQHWTEELKSRVPAR